MYTDFVKRITLSVLAAVCTVFSATAWAGLDGDNKIDAVFARSEQWDLMCLGDGAGNFTCNNISTKPADIMFSLGVALGDVNGDGKLDAVFSTTNLSPSRVCFGDGIGGFGDGVLDDL